MDAERRRGISESYKGNRYLVLGVGRHTETAELLAIDVPLHDVVGLQIAARPLAMFLDTVDVDGEHRAQFRFVGSGA